MASNKLSVVAFVVLLLVQVLPTLQLWPFLSYYDIPPHHARIIKRALWDADYRIMSRVLEMRLPLLEFSRVYPDQDELNLTIFAPRDSAIRFEPWINLDYQLVVRGTLDREAFASGNLPVGTAIATCRPEVLVITRNDRDGEGGVHTSINNVTVTDWDIYNDRGVAVHGVEDYFKNPNWRKYVDRPYDNRCILELDRVKRPESEWLRLKREGIVSS